MKIKRIEVTNLFDYYCYEIEMKAHDSISIIHAPNGYGKTTVFKMVTYLLNMDIIGISTIPFSKFIIEMSNGTRMCAEQVVIEENKQRSFMKKTLILEIVNEEGKKNDFQIPIEDPFLEFVKEEGIEEYVRRMEMRRRHSREEEREDAVNIVKKYERFNEKLDNIRESFDVNYIDSNRLFSSEKRLNWKERIRRDKFGREELVRVSSKVGFSEFQNNENDNENIIRDAKDILFKIQEARQIYSLESEKKDRNFPDRLVEYVDSTNNYFDDIQIAEQLEELEKKRLELENAGLVLSGKKTLAPSKSIDDTMRKFYTLYIQDTLKKLSLYDEIKSKLELFIEIINTRTTFSNKYMRIDNEKGIVFEPIESKSGKKHIIPLEKLSSGEKHDFIMFYELIFNSDKTSVFLIDEPEISLHVAWQMEFINVLEKICELNGTQAIVATHSPDIVNGHDDLMISLGVE